MNKTEIELLIAEQLPDNQERLISAQRLRQLLTTLSNSGFNLETDYTLLAHETNRQYSVGQIVEYNNKMYKCAIANTGAFEQANWVELTPSSLTPSGPAGGDLSGTYPNPSVGNNKITYAKFQQLPAYTVFGNNTSATANGGAVPTENISDLGNSIPKLEINGLWRWLKGVVYANWGTFSTAVTIFSGSDIKSGSGLHPNDASTKFFNSTWIKTGLSVKVRLFATASGTLDLTIGATIVLNDFAFSAGENHITILFANTTSTNNVIVLAGTSKALVSIDFSTPQGLDIILNSGTVVLSQIELA